MRKGLVLLLALFMICIMPTASRSQGLADLARQEKEKREKQKTSTKVYTNEDLDKYGPRSSSEAKYPPSVGETTQVKPNTPSKSNQTETKGEPDDQSTEKYWSKRFIEAKAKLQAAKSRQEALQAKLNDYNLRLLRQSDVYDREHLYMPLIAQTQDEIAKNKSEIAAAESELETLREELRKSGNPASWEDSQLALQPVSVTNKSQAPQVKDQKFWQEQLSQIDKRYDELIAPLNEERFQLLNRRTPREGEANPAVSSTASGLPPQAVDIEIQIKELNQRRQQEKDKLVQEAIQQGALPGWFR